MAKVPVGGANGLIDRLLTLLLWKATATVTDQERVDCLVAFNFAEQFVAGSEALKYLEVRTTLTANAEKVNAPTAPAIDYGKDYTIATSDGKGRIEVLAADEFETRSCETYDRITAKAAFATLATDPADSTLKFWFKPTPSAETLPITYQQIPPALTDVNTSYSLLPEGYELSLLLPIAEAFIKRRRGALEADFLDATVKMQLDAFYDKQRTSKQKPMTDQGRERRKIEEDQLAPGR